MSERSINLDVSKSSRLTTNLWFLSALLAVAVGAYASWRDLRDSDSGQSKNIEQVRKVNDDRYLRQENHFTASDVRISALEIQVTKTDAVLRSMAENIAWLRERQEYNDRQKLIKNQ